MRRSIYVLLIIFFPGWAFTQSLELMTPISDTVSESSSLLYLHQKLITNNDSGGEPKLYELDSLSGNVMRTITIVNSANVDWEALCYDSDYIYIGDFGNNTGSRTDLKIYRIPQNDFFNSSDDAVYAETISFHYSDQTDFSSLPFQTNYDAEAFIAFGDSLYIFSKNWGDHRTNVYPIPKIPGDYELTKTDSIDVHGLVTDASYNPENGTIMLSCYTLTSPFAFYISDFPNTNFSEGTLQTIDLQSPSGYSYQIEGVAVINPALYYFTSEGGFFGSAGLYKMELYPNFLPENHPDPSSNLFPNPATGMVTINADGTDSLIIYNASGQQVDKTSPGQIDISKFKSGVYIVKYLNAKSEVVDQKRLVIP